MIYAGFAFSLLQFEDDSVSGACPKMDYLGNSFTLTSPWIWGWHWYLNGNNFVAQTVCPDASGQGDSSLYVDDTYNGMTESYIFTATQQVDILDCGNSKVFEVSTGSFDVTILNTPISYTKVIKDASGNTLAYIKGSSFWGRSMKIEDATTGDAVASLTKPVGILTDWTIEISQANHRAADRALLILLASHSTFEAYTDDDHEYDGCTSYFNGVVGFLIAGASFVGLCLCCISCAMIKKCYDGECCSGGDDGSETSIAARV